MQEVDGREFEVVKVGREEGVDGISYVRMQENKQNGYVWIRETEQEVDGGAVRKDA